ncbi:hypothetical protein FQR65_LT20215 [Abscondita terminalis]|nr:hypothetical protein FQR65_LT20215 [Abscondita terminalis]
MPSQMELLTNFKSRLDANATNMYCWMSSWIPLQRSGASCRPGLNAYGDDSAASMFCRRRSKQSIYQLPARSSPRVFSGSAYGTVAQGCRFLGADKPDTPQMRVAFVDVLNAASVPILFISAKTTLSNATGRGVAIATGASGEDEKNRVSPAAMRDFR